MEKQTQGNNHEQQKIHLEKLKQFNENQADTRKRVDLLVRYILAVDGLALTISMGLFAKKDAPDLSESAVAMLQWSWSLLFISIVFMILVVLFMILGGYILGEGWRKELDGESTETVIPVWIDVFAWALGTAGLLSFAIGVFYLGWVAISSIAT
ncbi:hypothetical protein SAMN03080615_00894 [Amphritea atlantica]|uniref:Uncharacterized protein n=1 Tax=Amphritea atlantica TaxID=355243 RepID=A0A1H9EGN7_9GAMM|nr:hypothetical protein [Amphritea atlantica]SEQ24926.1 hypothetical protein SAMN03080615_00894 [Amphritea atlantica]